MARKIKIVGLTGGIGSGKTTVAEFFLDKGIPVYNSDLEAKKLMNENPVLIKKLTEIFGSETYQNGIYNSKFVASKVFQNKDLLQKLNETVHPEVFKHFHHWLNEQNSLFVVKEAAILFESGSYKDCDAIISVVADEKIRMKRVMERDQATPEQILSRMKNQMTDEQRTEYSDFLIRNNSDLAELHLEFEKVYKELLTRFESR